ncbi:MAG: hypothetical protein AB9836_14295 [Aminipila sp.]
MKAKATNQVTNQATNQADLEIEKLLEFCLVARSMEEMQEFMKPGNSVIEVISERKY